MIDKKVQYYFHYTREYRGSTHSIFNLQYSVLKVPIAFHNRSNHDYHFIIKELPQEFEKQFTCFEKITQKCITFTFLIKIEFIKTVENGENIAKYKSYLLQFIDRARFIKR